VANTVSLSFGALAVNDIVAAALAVTFVELVTRAFYTAWPNPCVSHAAPHPQASGALTRSPSPLAARPFSLWLLHCFKVSRASCAEPSDCAAPPLLRGRAPGY
jgi:hypothetical protein